MRFSIIALVLAGLFLPDLASADSILFEDGRAPVNNVDVIDETIDKVVYRRRGIRQEQSFPTEAVAEVEYAEAPAEYELARGAVEAGDFEGAAGLFKVAAANEERRKGLRAKCLYQAGQSLRRAGVQQEAVQVLSELTAAMPESRYTPMAELERGLAHEQAGEAAKARTAYEKLKADAAAKGYGERWIHEATLRLLSVEGAANPADALDGFQKLVNATDASFPSVAQKARLEIGRALLAQKQFDKARANFQSILDKRGELSQQRELIAGAWNGLGATRFHEAKEPADYRDALFSSLRVVVSYSDVVDEQAQALYYAGQCFKNLPGEESAGRAKQLLRRCVSEYPNSRWALEAQKG